LLAGPAICWQAQRIACRPTDLLAIPAIF
jgi:hypothetical protein